MGHLLVASDWDGAVGCLPQRESSENLAAATRRSEEAFENEERIEGTTRLIIAHFGSKAPTWQAMKRA